MPRRLYFYFCVFVSRITQKWVIFCEIFLQDWDVWSATIKRLHFECDSDHKADTGNFKTNFSTAGYGRCWILPYLRRGGLLGCCRRCALLRVLIQVVLTVEVLRFLLRVIGRKHGRPNQIRRPPTVFLTTSIDNEALDDVTQFNTVHFTAGRPKVISLLHPRHHE